MASYFGEVSGLSSRATDDEEWDEEPTSELLFDTKRDTTDINCEIVMFAVGKLAIAFVHSYFLPSDAEPFVCAKVVPQTKENDPAITGLLYTRKPKEVGNLFVNPTSDKVLLCEIDEDVPEEHNVALCEKISTFCTKTVQGIVLTSCHASSYQTSDTSCLQGSFLRCLATTQYRQMNPASNIPFLKPPNIVTNFPAAVLTEFEVTRKQAALFVCYTDVPVVDTSAVHLFDDVLNIPWICEKFQKNDDASNKLRNHLKTKQKIPDNLYT